ncbi:MAG: hypothetical protein R3B69_00215 [Candidatus Paceibacterota bacterium]
MLSRYIPKLKTVVLIVSLLCVWAALTLPVLADTATNTPETVDVVVSKAISGDMRGFSLSDFSYHVSGGAVDTIISHGGSVALAIGTYSIEELVPSGFFKSDWRIGWYGACDAGSAYTTSITIDEGNVDHGTLDCQADNQYRPDNGDNPEYGCTDVAANNYDESATIDDGSCEYDPDPIPGCTDSAANNYDPTATEDNGSCTYDETWLIEGYVWHDEDENGVIDETEDRLENWMLQITKDDTVLTTTSASDGYFSFYVPAGTWVLSEVVESGWSQVFPTPTSYTIVVPDDLQDQVTVGLPWRWFVNVAHAQVIGGPYNFGNVFTGSNGGGGNGFSCSLSADDTSVRENARVSLTWDASGSASTSIDNGVGSVAATGSTKVVVSSDTTYTLTAFNGSDTTTCSVAIDTEW